MTIEELYHERLQATGPNTAMVEYMPYLFGLTIKTRAKQIIELGVNTGNSTAAFLYGLQFTGGRLWSCDARQPEGEIAEFLDRSSLDWAQSCWTFCQGNTLESLAEFQKYIARPDLPDTPVLAEADILLVDAALENRFLDLCCYGPLVRTEGIILVHDTEREEVYRQTARYWDISSVFVIDSKISTKTGMITMRVNP